jgi:hypothetical protein
MNSHGDCFMDNLIWKIQIKKTSVFDIAEKFKNQNHEKIDVLNINSEDEIICEVLDVGSAKKYG